MIASKIPWWSAVEISQNFPRELNRHALSSRELAAERYVVHIESKMLIDNTFSIIGRCVSTGMFGVGVSTCRPAVGSRVPFALAGVGAIASQASSNPYLGIDGLKLLRQGLAADVVVDRLIGNDPDNDHRQMTVVDSAGRTAGYTGLETIAWSGHRTGDNYAVAGNMLVGVDTIDAMAVSFEATTGVDFVERLLRALEAGQARGGDKRGKQSAALYIVNEEEWAYCDLRSDDHADPVTDLRRVHGIWCDQIRDSLDVVPRRSRLGDMTRIP